MNELTKGKRQPSLRPLFRADRKNTETRLKLSEMANIVVCLFVCFLSIRRERFQSLEHANKRLQEQIEEVERQLHQLNYAFGLFVQHAECCGQCSNIRLGE